MHEDVQKELDIDFEIDQTFKPVVVNHPSRCTSSLTNLESSTVTDTGSEIEEVISNKCKIYSLSERRTALVDVELTTFKWEALHSESFRQGVNSDRCLKKGMRSSMQGNIALYHCPRPSSNRTSSVDIDQVQISQINSLRDRQQNNSFLFIENCGNSKPNNESFTKRGLGSNIAISAEQLPDDLNQEADWESRNSRDCSYSKLFPLIF